MADGRDAESAESCLQKSVSLREKSERDAQCGQPSRRRLAPALAEVYLAPAAIEAGGMGALGQRFRAAKAWRGATSCGDKRDGGHSDQRRRKAADPASGCVATRRSSSRNRTERLWAKSEGLARASCCSQPRTFVTKLLRRRARSVPAGSSSRRRRKGRQVRPAPLSLQAELERDCFQAGAGAQEFFSVGYRAAGVKEEVPGAAGLLDLVGASPRSCLCSEG